MKKFLLIAFVFAVHAAFSQTTFLRVHQKNGQVVKIPVGNIDSSTFVSESIVERPNLVTISVGGTSLDEAFASGGIFSNGGGVILERGICWAKTINPTTANNKAVSLDNRDTFFVNFSRLEPNTTYYVRAYAINSAGTNYGNQLTLALGNNIDSLAINGVYLSLFSYRPVSVGGAMHDSYGQKSIDLANDLMGNDMVVHSQGYGWYNTDYNYIAWQRESGVNTRSSIVWKYYYDIIQQVNKILDYISRYPTLTNKQQTEGECYALRAYAHFGLINNFQQTFKGNENLKGVPVYTLFGQELKGRGKVQDVYTQINNDLLNAELLLNGKPKINKTRIDINVVRGLRARVALAMEDYATAAIYANQARQGYSLMPESTYLSRTGFSVISNPEWMWGSFIPDNQATIFASFFSHMDATQFGYAQLGGQKKITKDLYDRIPTGDVRKNVFRAPGTGTSTLPDYTQTKFAVPTVGSWVADYLYMRASEMYLIEAEALARQGQASNAINVLETLVKQRFPAYSAATFSGAALLNEILVQRRIELWGEGFSLFDIKRTKVGLNRPSGSGNHGLPSLNPIVYTLPDASPQFIMRIPLEEIQNNPQMIPTDQNP